MELSLKFANTPTDSDWSAVRECLRKLVRANPQLCEGKHHLCSKFNSQKGEHWRYVDAEAPRFGRYKWVSSSPEGVFIGLPVFSFAPADKFLLKKIVDVQNAEFVEESLATVALAWLVLVDRRIPVTIVLEGFPAKVKADAMALARNTEPDLPAVPRWFSPNGDTRSNSESVIQVPDSMDFRG